MAFAYARISGRREQSAIDPPFPSEAGARRARRMDANDWGEPALGTRLRLVAAISSPAAEDRRHLLDGIAAPTLAGIHDGRQSKRSYEQL